MDSRILWKHALLVLVTSLHDRVIVQELHAASLVMIGWGRLKAGAACGLVRAGSVASHAGPAGWRPGACLRLPVSTQRRTRQQERLLVRSPRGGQLGNARVAGERPLGPLRVGSEANAECGVYKIHGKYTCRKLIQVTNSAECLRFGRQKQNRPQSSILLHDKYWSTKF